MAKFEVQIVESRDLVFEVEADNEEEAYDLAMDLDSTEAVRDSFRSRERDWAAKHGGPDNA
jgi:hypothetical protein